MKILALAFIMVIIMQCRKDIDPVASHTDATMIEGDWVSQYPQHDNWHYHFHSGVLNQEIIDVDGHVDAYQFSYATNADSLFITGPNGVKKCTLYFETTDRVQVTYLDLPVGGTQWWRRE